MILDQEGLSIARAVVLAASAEGRTLATAESLTGGLLGATITSVPGASVVYRGGLITYATDVKATLGGVPDDVLEHHGAVAAETAKALAEGAARQCGADVGLALTGVAGPAVQEGHPPGTVWLGWSLASGATGAQLLNLAGTRPEIRAVAVRRALELALALLQGDLPPDALEDPESVVPDAGSVVEPRPAIVDATVE
ncbi:CinA family protein [Granulicoccus sp. GXG6511]|uniref:CinA family protein n=1 Tax=Granulicoccus sp. GXG6511 TaxID=3381351 RepID=UPI003D7E86A7